MKLITLLITLIFISCTFGTLPEQIEPPCELIEIDDPSFRGYGSWYRTNVPDQVDVVWEPYRECYIENSKLCDNLPNIIKPIVSNYITHDSLIIIDHSGIIDGKMILDFNMYFCNPAGSWNPNGSISHYLYLEWKADESIVSEYINHRSEIIILEPNIFYYRASGVIRYIPMLQNQQSIILGSNANSALETTSLLEVLPGWQYLSLRHSPLDSVDLESVYDVILADCKCCVRLDIRGLPISQDYVDQFVYQEIELIQ